MRGSLDLRAGIDNDRRAWVVSFSVPGAQAAELGGPASGSSEPRPSCGPIRNCARLAPTSWPTTFNTAAGVQALRAADQSREIGEILLDQRVLAGIGNIYKCEGCWSARIHPWQALSDLEDEDLRRVVIEIGGLMCMVLRPRGRRVRSTAAPGSPVPAAAPGSRRAARAMRTGRRTCCSCYKSRQAEEARHNRRVREEAVNEVILSTALARAALLRAVA